MSKTLKQFLAICAIPLFMPGLSVASTVCHLSFTVSRPIGASAISSPALVSPMQWFKVLAGKRHDQKPREAARLHSGNLEPMPKRLTLHFVFDGIDFIPQHIVGEHLPLNFAQTIDHIADQLAEWFDHSSESRI